MVLDTFVREIFLKLNREEKSFLRGIPFKKDLEREINNFQKYLIEGEIKKQRNSFGEIAYDQSMPIGYVSFTSMNKANPTKYEEEFLGLDSPLNYVQCRQLVVDPEFRNKRIGIQLVNTCSDFAKEHKKSVVGDIKIKNKKMIYLFKKLGFKKEFDWKTPQGDLMLRVIKI